MAWKINDNPVAVFGGLSEVLRQGIPLLVLLGVWGLSKEQLTGLMLFLSPTITFLNILFTSNQTVSKSTADAQIQTALKADPNTTSVKDVIAQTKAGDP